MTVEFVLFKSNCQKCQYVCPTGRRDSLVETGRSPMDPQPHPLLHFLVRMKQTSTNVFLQVARSMEVTRKKIWAVRRMLKYFQPNLRSLSLTRLAVWGRALLCKKDDSVRQHSREFWFYGASQHPQTPSDEPHLSALLWLPPFPMLDEHTLH